VFFWVDRDFRSVIGRFLREPIPDGSRSEQEKEGFMKLLLSLVCVLLVAGCGGSPDTAREECQNAYSEAMALYRPGVEALERTDPVERAQGALDLYASYPLFVAIVDRAEWSNFDEHARAQNQVLQLKPFVRQEERAREDVAGLSERVQAASEEDASEALGRVRDLIRRYDRTSMAVVLAEAKRELEEKVQAFKALEIAFDDCRREEKALLREKRYGAALRVWIDFHDQMTSRQYRSRALTQMERVERGAREYAGMVVDRSRALGESEQARATLESALQHVTETKAEGLLRSELKRYRQ
jgi:hypothetical protein